MATRTAAQRRDQARVEFNAYLAHCPSRLLLDQLAGKWVTLVICALADEPRRYSELASRIAGVSPKMLTQTLRGLERDGLIDREIDASTVPVAVTYSLTDLGRSLLTVVLSMKRWAESNMAEISAHQEEFDAGLRPVRAEARSAALPGA